MFTPRRVCASSFLVLCLLSTAFAQGEQPGKPERPISQSSSTVTAAAAAERVRFTGASNVVQMQLQIYADSGQVMFDVTSKGNVLDWTLQDSGGERLAPGSYLCVVTVKNLSGKLSQRIGSALVHEREVELQRVDATQLTAPQQQAVGPIEENGALTILKAGEAPATTVLANNGNEGQVIRDRGALSFRIGDFFSGNDTEQMRLTEEGNLGIGTSKPKFRVDVAGAIRARQGFVFSDGSTLNVNDKGALTLTDSNGDITPNVAGTGTQNRLAKWTDSSGTLGDSVVLDTGTGLQLTVAANPSVDTNLLYLNSTTGTIGVLAGSTPSYGANNGPFFAMRGNTYSTIANQRGLFTIAAGNIQSPSGDDGSVKFNTGSDLLRMVIRPSGNVGIGISNPGSLLDVGGNINTSTQYNIGGQRLLSNAGTSNLFAGVGAGLNTSGFGFDSFFGSDSGGANTTGNRNSFFGAISGFSNTSGSFNSFFGSFSGSSNSTGDHNSFFGFLSGANTTSGASNSFFGDNAGSSNITGENNSFFGTSAGAANTVSSSNSYFGFRAGANSDTGALGGGNSYFGATAGELTTLGIQNAFFGIQAGRSTVTGGQNSFFGNRAGLSNETGNDNTAIGSDSDVGSNLFLATAIGAGAKVTQSDSLVLGRPEGTKVGIGVTAPLATIHVVSYSNSAANNTADFQAPTIGPNHSHIHYGANGNWYIRSAASAGKVVLQDTGGNVGIGTGSPNAKLQVAGGDVAVTTQGSGIILRATTDIGGPVCYRLTVDALGTLGTTSVVCP